MWRDLWDAHNDVEQVTVMSVSVIGNLMKSTLQELLKHGWERLMGV